MKTYELRVNGINPEQVEQAVKLMDKIVRRWYNVYGGRRVYSGKGAGGEWYIFMHYTAAWENGARYDWPGWEEIKRMYFRALYLIDKDDELEIVTRPYPWQD